MMEQKNRNWIDYPSADALRHKTIFVRLALPSGESYEGKGDIWVYPKPESSQVAIDLAFTQREQHQGTLLVVHLSQEQARQIRPAEGEKGTDYEYDGVLSPDIQQTDEPTQGETE